MFTTLGALIPFKFPSKQALHTCRCMKQNRIKSYTFNFNIICDLSDLFPQT